MAKNNKDDHADVMRQNKYPMPGTDLGSTTAIPCNIAVDVDAPGGSMSGGAWLDDYMLGKGDRYSNKSFVMGDRPETLIPAKNPTRQKR